MTEKKYAWDAKKVKVGDMMEYFSRSANNSWIQTEIAEIRSNGKEVLLRCHRKSNMWLKHREVKKVRLAVAKVPEAPGHAAPAPSKSRPDQSRSGDRPLPVPSPSRAPPSRQLAAHESLLTRQQLAVARGRSPAFRSSLDGSRQIMTTLQRVPRTPIEQTVEGAAALRQLETASRNKDPRGAAKARKTFLQKRKSEEDLDRQAEKRRRDKQQRRAVPLPVKTKPADKGHRAKSSHDRDRGRPSHQVEKKTKEDARMMAELFSEDDSPARSREDFPRTPMMTPGMTPAPEVHKRSRSSVELAPETPADIAARPAKKAKVKSQARPKAAPPAPVAPAPAAAPAGPDPLDKKGKQELQNKIDLLEDDYLEVVLQFLEADLGGAGEGDEVNLDLDNLAPYRQQQLVKVVAEELQKQRARQEAHARGERTPPESPIFDIGKGILTPLQGFQTAASEPPMSPMHLEPAAAPSKSQLPPPTATPTPFPTPSEYGDDHAERIPVEPVAQQKPKVPSASASPAARSGSGSSGQSVGKLMEDTISQAVRKAVRVTPELTESKTPRAQGPECSPKHSPKHGGHSPRTQGNDSMLDVLGDEELAALCDELPGERSQAASVVVSGTSV